MRVRPIDPVADFDAALEVLQAYDRAIYGGTDWTAEDLRETWDGLDPARDAWVVEEDGAVVGVAQVPELRTGTFLGDGYVHPAHRGRGIGAELVRTMERRARERFDEVPDGSPVGLHLAHLVGDPGAPALFAAQGFHRVRSFFRMVIELEDELEPPVWPQGLELRALVPERDGPALYEADVEAFAEEWGYEVRPYDAWYARMFVERRLDLSLPVVAWAGDEVAGFTLVYPKRMGDWGWIAVVGVVPSWRRRGLGLALLRESFRRIRATGETVAALGVDAENPTGATRLYERAGMRVLWQADVWEKELRPGA